MWWVRHTLFGILQGANTALLVTQFEHQVESDGFTTITAGPVVLVALM